MKRLRKRIENPQTGSVPRHRVITLADMVEVDRTDPPNGRQGRTPASERQPIDRSYQEGQPPHAASLPSWVVPATRCLNAYIRSDYSACVAAGRAALSLQVIPMVCAVMLLALRRQGRFGEAEYLSRGLLRCSAEPGGWLYLILMLLDGALDPERLLAGFRVEYNQQLKCQVYFYWGAKLLTEGKFASATTPLLHCVSTECDVPERQLAKADLWNAFYSEVN